MLIKRLPAAVFFLPLLLLSFSSNLFACACCAERGEYIISTQKPDEYQLGILGEMRFDKTAELYLDAAGFDDIKGLGVGSGENSDQFDLVASFMAKTWKFNIKTRDGKSGVLTLPVPTQMVSFKVDTHDTAEGDPVLYKELRYKGTVAGGTGIFKSGIVRPATYFLVFQGRGNNCDNASDFTHWRLEITGTRASYAFFGKMKTAGPAS
jgi:hypothetical protein